MIDAALQKDKIGRMVAQVSKMALWRASHCCAIGHKHTSNSVSGGPRIAKCHSKMLSCNVA